MSPLARSLSVAGCALMACVLAARVERVHGQEPVDAGLNDLVIYDPGVHERGLPAPQFVQRGEGLQIEIPPTIHVHRFYYSGDKEFQGPILQGGPTVVVANHPTTGERMYVDVVLPPGAPRVAYNKHGITYVYPDKRVSVLFQHFPLDPNKAVVKIQHGQGWGRKLHAAHDNVSSHVKEHLAGSPAVQSGKEAKGEAVDFARGVKVQLGDLGARSIDGLKTLTSMVPGVTYFKSLAEQAPAREQAASVRGARARLEREESSFVPTNR